jgi:hypothetical protein
MIRTRKLQVGEGLQLSASRWICEHVARVATVTFLLCGLLSVDAGVAQALNFEFGNDVGLDFDVTLSYGAAMRTKNPDSGLLADINADDGNRNFDKHDLVNNRFSVLAEIDLHKGDYGVFVRPRAFYDFAYDGTNGNDSPGTNNNSPENGGDTSFDSFHKDTKDAHRDKAEILDAFLYGTKSFDEVDTMFRVGQQAVNWGESLFILQGINGSTAYLDTTAANVPGIEVRELLMPTQQVYGELTRGKFTLAGFYQWQWEKNRLDESGSFFSTTDYLDDAGERLLVEVAPGVNASTDRVGDNDAKDSGQWGVALRYNAEALNDTEFGLYYVNYHEKMPIVIENLGSGGSPSPTMGAVGNNWGNLPVAPGVSLGDVDPATAGLLNAVDMSSYYLEYAENVKMIGASVSGIVGDTNVAGEVSYRDDMPIPFAAPESILGFAYEDSSYVQAQLSTISSFPAGLFYDNMTITTEIGGLRVLDSKELAPGKDRTSYGGVFQVAFDYFQIAQDLDLKVPVTLKAYPKGSAPILGTFTEDNDSLAVGLDFTYDAVYKVSFAYVNFLHGANNHPKADRDYASVNLKYTF